MSAYSMQRSSLFSTFTSAAFFERKPGSLTCDAPANGVYWLYWKSKCTPFQNCQRLSLVASHRTCRCFMNSAIHRWTSCAVVITELWLTHLSGTCVLRITAYAPAGTSGPYCATSSACLRSTSAASAASLGYRK